MAKYVDPRNDKFYRSNNPKYSGPKPEAHFYPDITDVMLKSDKYNIDFTLSYVDTERKINDLEDIHTTQMAFANHHTGDTHDIFIHYLDPTNDTQKIAHVSFNLKNEPVFIEWV